MSENDSNHKGFSGGLHIDVDTLSAGGNVQFSGRDSILHVHTDGNVSQSNENTITVGGVETTPKARDQIVERIKVVEEKVEAEPIEDDVKEAVHHYVDTIKKLLLSKKKPNPKILIDSVKSLTKTAPFVTGVMADVFAEPLVSEIFKEMGPSAMSFVKAFQAKFGG